MFAYFQHTLDGRMKELEGKIPHVRQQAEPMSVNEESKIMGDSVSIS